MQFKNPAAERAKEFNIKLVTQKSKETTQSPFTFTDDNTENRSALGHFEKKAVKKRIIISATSRARIKVQQYLEEDILNRNEDPLQWWSDYSYNYPHLSKVVTEKFGMVATSAPCESIFSKSGQLLISGRRSRLSVNKVVENNV
ncbi:unnamed protein product [Diabrotica balteata]|uniref:HAT C-terminal dimerisation domain-containing protein n=1 Tax=Diabrotica balteata TaxID=107213 RepID=A0A9N9T3A3_DIABA|nr:unnamed protein product [Diabrotica balteata]